jgi:hypothetical protein
MSSVLPLVVIVADPPDTTPPCGLASDTPGRITATTAPATMNARVLKHVERFSHTPPVTCLRFWPAMLSLTYWYRLTMVGYNG